MTYLNKCRVCLVDGAEHQIFESIERKDSIYSKLLQCFKEKVEDIEGYPRNICDSCKDTLNTICNFMANYKSSCEQLEYSLTVVKEEVCSDDEHSNIEIFTDELEVCKAEPYSEWLEMEDSIWNVPVTKVKKQETSLTEVKAKLKTLKEINFKKKTVPKTNHKNGKIVSSILEAEFNWNGESLKSNKIKEPEKPKEKREPSKLVLPKPPKIPQPSPPKLCDLCGKIFKDKDKLFSHKKIKHFSKPAKCPKCPKTLVSDDCLRRHIRRVHGRRDFVCDTCGSAFTHKGMLAKHYKKVHLKSSTPNRKYVCEKCKKGFITAKTLLIHDRSAHTGIRPAQCSECGACFFHEDYLKEHMRLHTGETPFKCPICGRGYAQRGNMKSHISHNHRLADLSEETLKNFKPSWFKLLKKP